MRSIGSCLFVFGTLTFQIFSSSADASHVTGKNRPADVPKSIRIVGDRIESDRGLRVVAMPRFQTSDGSSIAIITSGVSDENREVAFVRYLGDGKIDHSWGENGIVYATNLSSLRELWIYDATVDSAGNIIVAGDFKGRDYDILSIKSGEKIVTTGARAGDRDLFVAKFTPKGAPAKFGEKGSGIFTKDLGTVYDRAERVQVQRSADGKGEKIIIGIHSYGRDPRNDAKINWKVSPPEKQPYQRLSGLMRLNGDGTVDGSTFGNGGMFSRSGISTLDFEERAPGMFSLLAQAGGKGKIALLSSEGVDNHKYYATRLHVLSGNGKVEKSTLIKNQLKNERAVNSAFDSAAMGTKGQVIAVENGNGSGIRYPSHREEAAKRPRIMMVGLDGSVSWNKTFPDEVIGVGKITLDPQNRPLVPVIVQLDSDREIDAVIRFTETGEPDTSFGGRGTGVAWTGVPRPSSRGRWQQWDAEVRAREDVVVVSAGGQILVSRVRRETGRPHSDSAQLSVFRLTWDGLPD